MKKFIVDMHTHSAFSHDGRAELKDMLATAQKMGVAFYGVSEHHDFDVQLDLIVNEDLRARLQAQAGEAYFHTARHLQEDYEGVMNVAVGAEFGFSDDESVKARYLAEYEKFRPDYVINSVHTMDGKDFAYFQFDGDKKTVYSAYLSLIRRSLDAPYPYDIVGHIGYAARYVSFENVDFDLDEFGEQLDDIFRTVIAKGKILEVNTASKQLKQRSIPDKPLLKRYYELGGRKICFGSDAHFPERIADKWEETIAALKEIGFTYLTLPFRGEEIQIEI
ncbi:MAG: histidinol-phosphatase HisJ family protein [Clostridia bacterium]|nr:histidinol-phosphatase HisJ family protein [Clostridia bacterium]